MGGRTAGWRHLLGLSVALGLMAGCAALARPEKPPRPTPLEPRWEEAVLYEHLRFFNGGDAEGRGTGTQGYARAAAYAAARLKEYEVQPVLQGDFRLIYSTPVRYISGASLTAVGRDTLVFYPGIDFLPDGRSDSGTAVVNELLVWPERVALESPVDAEMKEAVLLAPAQATTAALERLRAEGVRVVLVAGPLRADQAAAALKGLLIQQLTPGALVRLVPAMAGQNPFTRARPEVMTLTRPLRVRVGGGAQPNAGAINVMGYVAGKHPVRASELVIVCADLDGVGPVAGVRTLDFQRFGMGAAALLDVARHYSYFGQLLAFPERTLLFGIWSGARLDHAGLRAYLENPTWALEQTRAVVYVGLAPEQEPAVRALLAHYGLPLYVIPRPEVKLFDPEQVLQADASVARLAAARGMLPPTPALNFSQVLQRAAAVARDLAAATHEVVLTMAVAPAPFQPVVEDTLSVPPLVNRPRP